jgi:hypothetical protein
MSILDGIGSETANSSVKERIRPRIDVSLSKDHHIVVNNVCLQAQMHDVGGVQGFADLLLPAQQAFKRAEAHYTESLRFAGKEVA